MARSINDQHRVSCLNKTLGPAWVSAWGIQPLGSLKATAVHQDNGQGRVTCSDASHSTNMGPA